MRKAKKAARKLFRKKKKKGGKDQAKEDPRSEKEKKNDLHKGVTEATQFVKSGSKDKKEVDKKFKQLEAKYLLIDLKLVHDKQAKDGTKKVHVHGEVNPKEDGPVIDWNVDSATDLTDAEIKKLKSIKGGSNVINKLDERKGKKDSTPYVSLLKEVRVMMSLKGDVIFVGMTIKAKPPYEIFIDTTKDHERSLPQYTEIDILTSSELIEVKSGNWGIKDRSSADYKQLAKFRNFINGKKSLIGFDGKPIDLSGRTLILQIEQTKVNPKVLAGLKKNDSCDVLKFGDGSTIRIDALKPIKPTKLKAEGLVSSASEYNALIP